MIRRSALLLSILATAACGPKPAAGPVAPKGAQPPAELAALFTAGGTWTFKVHTADDEPDETSDTGFKKVERDEEATCKVAGVGTFEGGFVSRIDCDEIGTTGGDPLAGLWVADDKGVYHVGDFALPAAGVAPTYDASMLIFPVPVAERSEQQTDPCAGADPIGEIAVTHEGDAWCWSQTWTMGDESWVTLCVAPDGPVNGTFGWAGGSTHEATFERK